MKFQKSLDFVKTMLARRLNNGDFDNLIASLGGRLLQRDKRSLMPTVVVFGVGAVLGAGTALMLAPMSGKELRAGIAALMRGRPAGDLHGLAIESDKAEPESVRPQRPMASSTIHARPSRAGEGGPSPRPIEAGAVSTVTS